MMNDLMFMYKLKYKTEFIPFHHVRKLYKSDSNGEWYVSTMDGYKYIVEKTDDDRPVLYGHRTVNRCIDGPLSDNSDAYEDFHG